MSSKMEWTWPENVWSNRERVMEELDRGRKMVSQLRRVLSGDVASAEGLVTKILGSFTSTLLILNGSTHEAKEHLTSPIQANSNTSTVIASTAGGADSSCLDALEDGVNKSGESNDESCKSTETIKADRRGSYKRRKTSHSWTKDTLDLVDDGHAWRKYGQKQILNTPHPRNYFRCTHKFEQGCKATKHVQRITDEPQLYRTTYYGNHTCTDFLRAPELILDCSSSGESSENMIRFDNTKSDSTSKFLSSFSLIKQESIKDDQMITSITVNDHMTCNKESSREYLISPRLGVFETFEPITESSSTIGYDQDDAFYSRLMIECLDDGADFSYGYGF